VGKNGQLGQKRVILPHGQARTTAGGGYGGGWPKGSSISKFAKEKRRKRFGTETKGGGRKSRVGEKGLVSSPLMGSEEGQAKGGNGMKQT